MEDNKQGQSSSDSDNSNSNRIEDIKPPESINTPSNTLPESSDSQDESASSETTVEPEINAEPEKTEEMSNLEEQSTNESESMPEVSSEPTPEETATVVEDGGSDVVESSTEPKMAETSITPETPADTGPKPQIVTSKDKKSHKGLLLILIILVLLVIGAGVYYTISKKSTAKSTASTAVVKKDIPNITYATSSPGWDSFYPAIDDSSSYGESNIMIFEGLVRFENKTQIAPLLATGWNNPDSSTWVFNLRNDVKFHDGRTMTAEDVKLSFDDAKNSNMGQILATSIKSVDVTGPNQITIKTDGPDPTLLKKLTLYYVYDTKSGKQNDPINGTGPFTIKPGTTASANSLQLVAFDQYWGGRPHVRSFSFLGLDSFDHGKAYGDGKANLMSMFADKPTLTGTRKYAQQSLDQSSVFLMPLNTRKAGTPLAKLQVRQAIQLALDPLAIAKVRNTNAIAASQIVPSSIPGYDPSITRPARDVTKAKALLTQAGYPNGVTFTLTYFTASQATADEMAKELAEAGITMKEDPQTVPQTMIDKYTTGQTDAVILTFTSDIFDGSDVLNTYDNSANYQNQNVVDLVTKANSTLDSTVRLGYLKQASHLMATDLGVEPIFVESGDSIIYDPSFVIHRDIANNTLGIYFQNVYAK